eukprot:CAMPEP_0194328840 /NCGR_PEP_ID=MMETSP0171-20130528/46147_1 /TAXON_ID=218684 /ORGANISM="Corethron pennatum, Strain L29A3" /LENGTH=90 /DNA_ID=CAMNT_0039089339 /DNA_START=373 /DNA_END=642 /DNA_ORIENTATION=-
MAAPFHAGQTGRRGWRVTEMTERDRGDATGAEKARTSVALPSEREAAAVVVRGTPCRRSCDDALTGRDGKRLRGNMTPVSGREMDKTAPP